MNFEGRIMIHDVASIDVNLIVFFLRSSDPFPISTRWLKVTPR